MAFRLLPRRLSKDLAVIKGEKWGVETDSQQKVMITKSVGVTPRSIPYSGRQPHRRSHSSTLHHSRPRGKARTHSFAMFIPVRASLDLAPRPRQTRKRPVSGASPLHSTLSSCPPHTTAIGKLMSLSSQGTSGPSGRAGFQSILEPPITTEKSLFDEIKKLNVNVFFDVLNFGPWG